MPLEPAAIAVVADLMFMVKIQEAAKSVQFPIAFVKSLPDLTKALADSKMPKPTLVLFDLNLNGSEAIAVIRSLKEDPATRDIHLVGFISHVQIEARAAAEAAGCDAVVARSVFAQQLPSILSKYGMVKSAGRPE